MRGDEVEPAELSALGDGGDLLSFASVALRTQVRACSDSPQPWRMSSGRVGRCWRLDSFAQRSEKRADGCRFHGLAGTNQRLHVLGLNDAMIGYCQQATRTRLTRPTRTDPRCKLLQQKTSWSCNESFSCTKRSPVHAHSCLDFQSEVDWPWRPGDRHVVPPSCRSGRAGSSGT